MSEETNATEVKAKSIIFKSLKVGQLFYVKDEKNHPKMDVQYVKQTKEAASATGSTTVTLVPMEPKTKCSIFYNIKDLTPKKPRKPKMVDPAAPATV